jgi:hypothetical protein
MANPYLRFLAEPESEENGQLTKRESDGNIWRAFQISFRCSEQTDRREFHHPLWKIEKMKYPPKSTLIHIFRNALIFQGIFIPQIIEQSPKYVFFS